MILKKYCSNRALILPVLLSRMGAVSKMILAMLLKSHDTPFCLHYAANAPGKEARLRCSRENRHKQEEQEEQEEQEDMNTMNIHDSEKVQRSEQRVVMDVRDITKSLPLGRERIDILKG